MRNVKDRNLDGVICGHLHAATIREIEGITYVNCGDWVDSCSAAVEHRDGSMEVIQWGARTRPQVVPADDAAPRSPAATPPRIAA